MKPLVLLLMSMLLSGSVWASPVLPATGERDAAQAAVEGSPPPNRLRDVRLREAVERGEITQEEARAIRHLQRWHRLAEPPRDASEPQRQRPPRHQRWRQQQDTQRTPPPD